MYDFLFVHEWPWWFGGPVMGLFVLMYGYVYNRTVGMSSTLENAYRSPFGAGNLETQSAQDAALEAIREMNLSPEELEEMGISQEEIDALQNQAGSSSSGARQDIELSPAVFLLAGLLGACLMNLIAGGGYALTLGDSHAELFPVSMGWTVAILFFGGLVGGFGARMAGGCPSGHGLAGLSLFSPGSLVALASYFVTGVALSFALEVF
jgi:hypothetical protein